MNDPACGSGLGINLSILVHEGLIKATFHWAGSALSSFKSGSWVRDLSISSWRRIMLWASVDGCLLVKPNLKCAMLYASGQTLELDHIFVAWDLPASSTAQKLPGIKVFA